MKVADWARPPLRSTPFPIYSDMKFSKVEGGIWVLLKGLSYFTSLNNLVLQLLKRAIKEEGGCIPSFPKPVAHDSNHTGPTSGLQQAIHNPQAAVQPLVVEMQPFCDSAKDKHLRGGRKKKGHVTSTWTL